MAGKVLTEITLKQLKAQTGKQYDVWDGKLKGFGVRVSQAAAKSFVVSYRVKGRKRRVTIGRYPDLSLADARALALQTLGQARAGVDPRVETPAAGSGLRFADVVDDFLTKHCARRNKQETARETGRILRKEFMPPWGAARLDEVTRADVLNILDDIVERGSPIMANRALAAIRKLFSFCLERGLLETSPCANLKAPSLEQSRNRVLDDLELTAIWRAAENMGPPYGTIVRLLILTAQRREIVGKMRWSQLNFETKLWSLPPGVTKNKQPRDLPLTGWACELIASIPRDGSADLVFASHRNSEHAFSGYSKCKIQLDCLAPIPHWRLHDLRRSFSTRLAERDVPPHWVERVLDHTSGTFRGVAGVYNRAKYIPQMRKALESWETHVKSLLD